MKQTTTNEANTNEAIVTAYTSEQKENERTLASDEGQALMKAAPSRSEKRKEARLTEQEQKKYSKKLFRFALIVAAILLIGAELMKGYGVLKNYGGKKVTIARFEQALKEKDIAALKKYIRMPDSNIPVTQETLQPLFAYLDKNPEAYKKLHSDLEKQLKNKPVYIKGLTSKPPIFLMKVYEKQYFLFSQYIFEPAFYSLNVSVEGKDVTLFVNGKEVHKTTGETFSGKIGSYLPGIYKITAVYKGENKTKKKSKEIVLFGGQRVQWVHFQLK